MILSLRTLEPEQLPEQLPHPFLTFEIIEIERLRD